MNTQHVIDFYRSKLLAGVNQNTVAGRDIGDKYALYAAIAVSLEHARRSGLA